MCSSSRSLTAAEEFFTAATQTRHKCFVVPAGERAGPLWEASAFEVVQEGVAAAEAQELEAKEDEKLNIRYVKHFGAVVTACVGITAGIFFSTFFTLLEYILSGCLAKVEVFWRKLPFCSPKHADLHCRSLF